MKILGSARAILLIGASLTVASTATAVQAQNEQAPAARDAGTNEGDIVVTALRRSESLQDVPAAITAFTSEAIENAGIERPSDFINLTSNVNLVETQNAGNAFIIIRGITQARNSEPSVAVVVDGVQQVNPAQFNQELFDIEQIEVLKGPQGAIYGRNAIGGAIVIRTKQPTDHFEGRVRAGVDNGFGYWLRGGISGPMSDTLKFRLSGSWYDTKGFIRNEFLKEDTDPVEDLALRGTLLWSPTSNFTADLRGSISRLRTQALYFNIVNDVNDTSLPVRTNNAGQNDRDINNVSLRLNYDTDAGSFSSVTSYDTLKEILTGDAFDFLPIEESFFFRPGDSPLGFGLGLGFDLTQSQYLNVKALSQEIRFTSPEANRLRYIVGAYFIDTNRFISTGNMVDTGAGVFPVYRTPSTNPLNNQFSFLSDKQDNFAWAAFANLSYDFTDQFKIDLGLRYDRDRRRNTTLTPAEFMNGTGQPNGTTGEVRKAVFDDWQPKVTLTWEPSNTVTVYGGYSRGFRSGGFNQTGVGGVAAANGIVGVEDLFQPETVDTFEAGVRTQLLDRHLTLTANAYTTESKNSYFFHFLAANSTQNLGNVPRTRINGFELEATARPAPGLDLNVGFGYTNSNIKAFPDPAYIGNEAPLISRYTLNMGSQYRTAIGSDAELIARVDYRRTGKTWWDVQNSTVRKPVDLVDARLAVEFGPFSVAAFASNLFNEKYNAEFSPGGFVFKARPRRYGAEMSFKF